MLARIRGSILALESTPPMVVIEPEGQPGLGYEVLLPAYLVDQLIARETGTPRDGVGGNGVGGVLDLHTIQYLEGVNQGVSFIPRLIGFTSPRDREFFELLTSVKGLGNKRALRAMAVAPSSIARAIAERDARFLQRLPEIGPKLAELIVHELKNKVDGFAVVGGDEGVSAPEPAAAQRVEPKPAKRSKLAPPTSDAAPSSASARRETPSQAAAPPIRQTIDALIALGESPIDAERMVNRAIDKARAAKVAIPATTQDLLTAAYAARN